MTGFPYPFDVRGVDVEAVCHVASVEVCGKESCGSDGSLRLIEVVDASDFVFYEFVWADAVRGRPDWNSLERSEVLHELGAIKAQWMACAVVGANQKFKGIDREQEAEQGMLAHSDTSRASKFQDVGFTDAKDG